MKKLLICALLLSLAACGGNKTTKPEKKPTVVHDCVFPNSNTVAPSWVCDEPVPGIVLSAVGIADKSAAGISYMKDLATLDGRGRLAEQMKVQVSKMVKKYLGTTGIDKSETIDAAASTTLKSVTSESLVGSKIYKTRTGPDGKLYVLVGIDENAVQNIAEATAKTSMNNNRALWQQFKSKQSFDEMAKDIAAQKVQ